MSTNRAVTKGTKKILGTRRKAKPDIFERKEKRLQAEIEKLIANLYNTNARDSRLRYENLKTYRIEIIRGFIVYAHLAMEDLLRDFVVDFIKHQTRLFPIRKVKNMVEGMRSAEVIEWCARLNLVAKKQYEFIKELNKVRNSCAHNWLLDIPRYKKVASKKMKKWIKTPVVRFNNKNLFNEKVFRNEFLPLYSKIYLKLLWKDWRVKGII